MLTTVIIVNSYESSPIATGSRSRSRTQAKTTGTDARGCHKTASTDRGLALHAHDDAQTRTPTYCTAECNAYGVPRECTRAACMEKEGSSLEIFLHPGTQADRPSAGRADLGLAKLAGSVAREAVAQGTVGLLGRATGGKCVWLDQQEGRVPVGQAVGTAEAHDDPSGCISGWVRAVV